jgi:hypothetical protein
MAQRRGFVVPVYILIDADYLDDQTPDEAADVVHATLLQAAEHSDWEAMKVDRVGVLTTVFDDGTGLVVDDDLG